MIIEMSGDTFPQNLLYLRKKYELSRRALGKLIGISPYTIKDIETGVLCAALPIESFNRLCEVLHIPPGQLAKIDLTAEQQIVS